MGSSGDEVREARTCMVEATKRPVSSFKCELLCFRCRQNWRMWAGALECAIMLKSSQMLRNQESFQGICIKSEPQMISLGVSFRMAFWF